MRKDPQIDTLRACDTDIAAAEASRRESASRLVAHDKRRAPRLPYDDRPRLPLRLLGRKVAQVTYLVKPRNLSTTGFGFLYGSFLYPGSRCEVTLTTLEGLAIPVPGTIRRCVHLHGKVHEVGVAFDYAINLREFIQIDEPEPSDQEVAVQLTGRLLYLDANARQRELMRLMLGRLGVDVVMMDNAGEALQLIEASAFDMVITDGRLTDLPATDFVQAVRISGYEKPVVLLTADERDSTVAQAKEAGADAVLPRPFHAMQLNTLLGSYLRSAPSAPAPRSADAEPVVSTFWADREMRPLILSFLDGLSSQVRALRASMGDMRDTAAIEQLCLDIKGGSGSFGFPQISALAREVFESVSDGADAAAVKASVEALTRLCESACAACDGDATNDAAGDSR